MTPDDVNRPGRAVDPVTRFLRLVTGPEPELDEGALAIAAGAHRDPQAAAEAARRARATLDELAEGVTGLESLLHRLFTEAGFTGNTRRYRDPRNSLLPDVLERRTGIPITLAVVTIEVGRRAGVPLEGVGMPGHFLVRVPGTQRHLDVFDRGRRLDLAGCEALFRTATGAGPDVPFGAGMLPRTTTRKILARMLENLRASYGRAKDHTALEWVLRMRLGLRHQGPELIRELGEVLAAQARWDEAARLLESWTDGPGRGSRSGADVLEQVRLEARMHRAHLN
ncbi:transglutaminase-like domain-containing protein [Pseudonocardia parietis]|uniref:Regulator of sirC expression with transglutaminase-like and TPR domain n=1 Tax=Pseudonocardia parietis TaxID=570936 RepID=A0ABS4VN10_9PSEU|nr:transglutaminase-like domain-containing protein [Pseudonocardia parietis]MBP2365313.1 regulator of sirC expression with transglutaminase-like and TPR domain [Pseudonocardia parietis]